MTNLGSGYTSVPTVSFVSASGSGATATAIRGTSGANLNKITGVTITNGGTGYQSAPVVQFTGGGGTGAQATSTIEINIDNNGDSFADNNKFKEEAVDVLFSETNPFGEIQ
jgi:hypothetical protein